MTTAVFCIDEQELGIGGDFDPQDTETNWFLHGKPYFGAYHMLYDGSWWTGPKHSSISERLTWRDEPVEVDLEADLLERLPPPERDMESVFLPAPSVETFNGLDDTPAVTSTTLYRRDPFSGENKGLTVTRDLRSEQAIADSVIAAMSRTLPSGMDAAAVGGAMRDQMQPSSVGQAIREAFVAGNMRAMGREAVLPNPPTNMPAPDNYVENYMIPEAPATEVPASQPSLQDQMPSLPSIRPQDKIPRRPPAAIPVEDVVLGGLAPNAQPISYPPPSQPLPQVMRQRKGPDPNKIPRPEAPVMEYPNLNYTGPSRVDMDKRILPVIRPEIQQYYDDSKQKGESAAEARKRLEGELLPLGKEQILEYFDELVARDQAPVAEPPLPGPNEVTQAGEEYIARLYELAKEQNKPLQELRDEIAAEKPAYIRYLEDIIARDAPATASGEASSSADANPQPKTASTLADQSPPRSVSTRAVSPPSTEERKKAHLDYIRDNAILDAYLNHLKSTGEKDTGKARRNFLKTYRDSNPSAVTALSNLEHGQVALTQLINERQSMASSSQQQPQQQPQPEPVA